MIDTVVLVVPMPRMVPGVRCNGTDEWKGWQNLRTESGFKTYARNPTPLEKESGQYFPRLTGYQDRKRGWMSVAKIEFSVPKLVYGNSLDELENSQFGEVVSILRDRLTRMGFAPRVRALTNAEISMVHYSKNFHLHGGQSTHAVISKLRRINVHNRFRNVSVEYSDYGRAMSIGNKSHSIIFYDKIDETAKNLGTDAVRGLRGSEEVVRLEVRLKTKRKMNSLLAKLGFRINPTFRGIFSEETSRAVLEHYWQEVVSKDAAAIFSQPDSEMDLLRGILASHPRMKAHKALKLTGMLLTSRAGNGLDELRGILSARMEKNAWGRLVREFRVTVRELRTLKPEDWFLQIESQLGEFNPLRLLQE